MHSHFNLNYSLVGKHHVVGKDLGTYGQSNIFDHDLSLLTIISVINELGGETLNPYLSHDVFTIILYGFGMICMELTRTDVVFSRTIVVLFFVQK